MNTVDKSRKLIARLLHKQGDKLHKLHTSASVPLSEAVQLPGSAALEAIRRIIQSAWDWGDLEKALDRAQGAYMRGELAVEQVEEVAILAAQKSHELPERYGAYTPFVRSYDLLEDPDDGACRCCRQNWWWSKTDGQQVCSICHPQPRKEVMPMLVAEQR